MVLAIIIVKIDKSSIKNESVDIKTNKSIYFKNEILNITIKNNLNKSICFSSCYPYYLEKKDKGQKWKLYPYGKCPRKDIIQTIIYPSKSKTFEIRSFRINNGLHRIVVPIDIGCKKGDKFREVKRYYSNEFTIR